MNSEKKEKPQYKIGSQIKKYREVFGLSQKELADRLGISNSRVSNWEQGINRPDADMLADICIALNVSPSELLDVHLNSEEYTSKEKEVLAAYRGKPELQHAVHLLLVIDDE